MKITIEFEIPDDTEYPYETVPYWEVLAEGLLADNGFEEAIATVRIEE